MIQIGILYFGVVIFTRIRNLPNQKPLCPDNICSLEVYNKDHLPNLDKPLCQKCNLLQTHLKKRLPIITRTIVFFFSLQVCSFILYNTQSAINIFGKTEDFYDLNPIVLLIELLTELIVSGFILTAICYAQKKRTIAVESQVSDEQTVDLGASSINVKDDDFIKEGSNDIEFNNSMLRTTATQEQNQTSAKLITDSEVTQQPANGTFEDRMSALVRITTLVGDDIDARDSTVKSLENDPLSMRPKQRMYESSDDEQKDLFD